MLGIVDYNAGNQTSVRRALEYLSVPCIISNDPKELATTDGLIFPGVGAAGSAMVELKKRGLDRFLIDAAAEKMPILGICLGCQILLTKSEENETELLNIIPGSCKHFPEHAQQEDGSPAPIPHMGWNRLAKMRESSLLEGISQQAFFYFVHSYYVEPSSETIIATANYTHTFCAIYGYEGLWGVQFHPEKSGACGLKLLHNFSDFCSRMRYAQ